MCVYTRVRARMCMCVRMHVCVYGPAARGECRPSADPPTTGPEPRPPSHVSAAATCHALPGLGSVMERSLSVGEGGE